MRDIPESVEIGDCLSYAYCPTPNGSVLFCSARVVGKTPKRVKVKLVDQHDCIVTKTVSPDSLRLLTPAEKAHYFINPMAGTGNAASDWDAWAERYKRWTWEDLR